VRLVACGGGDPEWDWEVLKTAGNFIDYISYHDYFRPDPDGDPYETLVARGYLGGRYLRDLWGLIEAARHRYGIRRPIHICVDEWNVFYRRNDFARYGTLHESSTTSPTRWRRVVPQRPRAHRRRRDDGRMAQMVNVIAPVFASPEGLFLQTIYAAADTARHRGGVALDGLSGVGQLPDRGSMCLMSTRRFPTTTRPARRTSTSSTCTRLRKRRSPSTRATGRNSRRPAGRSPVARPTS
jgi:alpha-N-arabinofuranosidase